MDLRDASASKKNSTSVCPPHSSKLLLKGTFFPHTLPLSKTFFQVLAPINGPLGNITDYFDQVGKRMILFIMMLASGVKYRSSCGMQASIRGFQIKIQSDCAACV